MHSKNIFVVVAGILPASMLLSACGSEPKKPIIPKVEVVTQPSVIKTPAATVTVPPLKKVEVKLENVPAGTSKGSVSTEASLLIGGGISSVLGGKISSAPISKVVTARGEQAKVEGPELVNPRIVDKGTGSGMNPPGTETPVPPAAQVATQKSSPTSSNKAEIKAKATFNGKGVFELEGIIEDTAEICRIVIDSEFGDAKKLTLIKAGVIKFDWTPNVVGASPSSFDIDSVFSIDANGKALNDTNLRSISRKGRGKFQVHSLPQTPGTLNVEQNVKFDWASSTTVIDEVFNIEKRIWTTLSRINLTSTEIQKLSGSRQLQLKFLPGGKILSSYTLYVMPVYSGIPSTAKVTTTAFDEMLPKGTEFTNASVVPAGEVAGQERSHVCNFMKTTEEKMEIGKLWAAKQEAARVKAEAKKLADEANLKARKEEEAAERFKQYTRPVMPRGQ